MHCCRFEALTARARRSVDTDPERAADLEQALSLWRGPVLADIAGGGSRPDAGSGTGAGAPRATLAYADIALAVGRHVGAAEALSVLAGEEPLDERLHALMLALAAAGDQARALRVHQEITAPWPTSSAWTPAPSFNSGSPIGPSYVELPGVGRVRRPSSARSDSVRRGDADIGAAGACLPLPPAQAVHPRSRSTGLPGVGKTSLAIEANSSKWTIRMVCCSWSWAEPVRDHGRPARYWRSSSARWACPARMCPTGRRASWALPDTDPRAAGCRHPRRRRGA